MTKRYSLLMTAAIGIALLAAPLHAQDSATLDHNYFALKLTLGIGGSAGLETDSVSIGTVNVNVSDPVRNSTKLLPSYGLAGQYMFSLHRYFALGGLLGVMTWNAGGGSCVVTNNGNCVVQASSGSNSSRNVGLDLDVVPQGRLPLTNALELYLALPIGLTVDFWNQPQTSASVGGIASAEVKAGTGVGFNVSLLAGARYALAEHFGVFTEVGFTHRQFSHELTLTGSVLGVNLGTSKADTHLTLDQFAWNIGAFF